MANRRLDKRYPPRMICALASLAALCCGWPAIAETRLRITERNASQHVGTFGGWREDTLLLNRSGGRTAAIALPAIATAEESRGVHGHSLAAAGFGLAAGVIAGSMLGARLQPLEGTGANSSFAVGGAIVFGAAGALIGALAGTGWRSEAWRPISKRELRLEMGLNPSGTPQWMLVRRF